MKNIMFIGKMCSGKTYCADILTKHGYTKLSLATPIKEMEAGLDDAHGAMEFAELVYPQFKYFKHYTEYQLNAMMKVLREAKKIPSELPKSRKRLQYIGTEGGRMQVDDKLWIKILQGKMEDREDGLWVVDDVRFKNEYTQLSALFTPVKISITQELQMERIHRLYPGFDEEALNHASETELESIDTELTLDGSLSYDETEKLLLEIIND